MKFRQFIFIILFSLLGLQFVIGQEKPKAILLDEISQTNCCSLDARTDSLLIGIKENADSKGFIIIFYPKRDFFQSLRYERIFLARTNFTKNISIIRVETENEFKVQFWFVPNGAESSFDVDNKPSVSLANQTKPKLIFTTNQDGCYEIGHEKQLAELLSANADLRGNVVIFAKSRKEFLKEQKTLRNELVNKLQVPKNRIKFIFSDIGYPYVEYWLVPKKKPY